MALQEQETTWDYQYYVYTNKTTTANLVISHSQGKTKESGNQKEKNEHKELWDFKNIHRNPKVSNGSKPPCWLNVLKEYKAIKWRNGNTAKMHSHTLRKYRQPWLIIRIKGHRSMWSEGKNLPFSLMESSRGRFTVGRHRQKAFILEILTSPFSEYWCAS